MENKPYMSCTFGEKKKIKKRQGLKIKSPFGLLVLITQFSVSITYNSKMVEPIAKSLFDKL